MHKPNAHLKYSHTLPLGGCPTLTRVCMFCTRTHTHANTHIHEFTHMYMYLNTHTKSGGDPRPSSWPLSQKLLVVRPCATPLSWLLGNRGCINMRRREGAGDTSCLWSENNNDSVCVRRPVRSQRPAFSLSLSICLSLTAVLRSRSAQLVRDTRSATGAQEKVC